METAIASGIIKNGCQRGKNPPLITIKKNSRIKK
jgi:hypothetical protein